MTDQVTLDPVVEAERLSDTVSKLAFEVHGNDSGTADEFISGIIVGRSLWADATRGMAKAKYSILSINSKVGSDAAS